jgi:hypothetical protein
MEEQNVQTTNQRPTFLTVLCILTFIGSGLGVLFSLFGIFGIGALDSFISNYGGVSTDTGIMKPVLILIFSGASLYGAIMMWGLKKMGFYLYVVAQILIVAFGWSIMALIFALLFIILYGLNLKHLQ